MLKAADLDLIIVSGIDGGDVRGRNQVIPVFGFNISTDKLVRVDILDTHGNDFFFQFDSGPQKGGIEGFGLLEHDIGKACIPLYPLLQGVYRLPTAGHRTVNTFCSDQQGAFNGIVVEYRQQLALQSLGVANPDETIQCADDDGVGFYSVQR